MSPSCHNLDSIKKQNADCYSFHQFSLQFTSRHCQQKDSAIKKPKHYLKTNFRFRINQQNINKVFNYCSGIGGIEIFEEIDDF